MAKKNIVAFIDAPDPDNFVMVIALARLNPDANIHLCLTGRPVKFNATKECKLWEFDMLSSRMAQEASAMRLTNFLRHFGVKNLRVYDGGIAPRTLVPHHIHFSEYYKFLDVDPLAAIRHSELEPQEELCRVMMDMDAGSCDIAVGGPMTGLHQVLVRCPEVSTRLKSVHAMYATWGTVQLMQMGDAPRGALQFNVACDPHAAHEVLYGLDCPIYLMPSEVTRVKEIGFQNAQSLLEYLPQNSGSRALYNLYALWYDAAVRPRQEKNPDEWIFIHDLVATFSLDDELRNGIYEVVPVEITAVPHLYRDYKDWGKVLMTKTDKPSTRYAGLSLKEGGAAKYLDALKKCLSV